MQRGTRKSGGGIRAIDSRYTGEEPIWDGWETWPIEKFWKEYSRLFNFYNYYLTPKDSKPAVLEWMALNGYSKQDIAFVKDAPDYCPGMTAGALCICMNRGMPVSHPQSQEYLANLRNDPVIAPPMIPADVFVREKIEAAIVEGKKVKIVVAQETPTEKTNFILPMDRLRAKCNKTIIMDLDLMIDNWIAQTKLNQPIAPLLIYKLMKHYELPPAACGFVEEYLKKILTEYLAAAKGDDRYLQETYSHLNKKQLNSHIEALTLMLDDLVMFKTSAKAAKPPRKKKITPASKQVEKIQYLKHSEEFKITSINPVRIIGSHRLLAFNVKTRILFDYVTSITSGFIVKGTTIQNYDEVASRCIRLRKPDEFIPIAVGSTEKQLEKAWEQLTTKIAKPNGRINSDIVLLRIL